jgi:uncharacterized OsmC-like protein
VTQAEANKSSDTGIIQLQVSLSPGENRRMIGRARDHTVILDVSKERGGDNAAPTPPEYLALSLGGCVLNMVRNLATAEGLNTTGLQVIVSSDLDPAKAFGLSSENRAGFLGLNVSITPPDAWSDETRENILSQLRMRCPICDTVQNPTDLTIQFE